MKKSIKKLTAFLGMLLLATFIIHGCSDVSDPYGSDIMFVDGIGSANVDIGGGSVNDICVDETITELTYSPKKKYGGDISYEVTDTEVIVTYLPREGWGITETHLLVTVNENELSTIPGQFPYGDEFDSAQSDPIVYTIPLSDLGINSGSELEDLYIYAHAVTGELSGGSYWGGGGSWWGKSSKSKKDKYGKDDDDDHKKSKYGKYDNDDRGKKGKYGKYGKDDDDHKWGKKGKYGKDDDDDHKWGKKSEWDKDDKDDKWGEKRYCDKTESVWAKIHIENFEDCGGSGVGGTD